MDMKKAFEYAAVLAPAIVCVSILVLPVLAMQLRRAYENLEAVELAKDYCAHGSFYGPAVTVFVGYGGNPYGGWLQRSGLPPSRYRRTLWLCKRKS